MLARRLLLFGGLLVLVGLLVFAINPGSDQSSETKQQVSSPRTTAPKTGAGNTITGELSTDPTASPVTIKGKVGDTVSLVVSGASVDTVEVLGEGIIVPIDPSGPASLYFLADQPGTYPVTLGSDGRKIGVVEITK
jgi:hypothetical protein